MQHIAPQGQALIVPVVVALGFEVLRFEGKEEMRNRDSRSVWGTEGPLCDVVLVAWHFYSSCKVTLEAQVGAAISECCSAD